MMWTGRNVSFEGCVVLFDLSRSDPRLLVTHLRYRAQLASDKCRVEPVRVCRRLVYVSPAVLAGVFWW